jgi:hypothetical protein
MARSRSMRNREHPVTVRATEETDIVYQPDAGDARAFTAGTWGWRLQEKAEACGASSSCFSFRKVSRVERWALGQRDDHEGCLETGKLLLRRGGCHVSHEFVDAREAFSGVVAFECHVGPCLSREKASIGFSWRLGCSVLNIRCHSSR